MNISEIVHYDSTVYYIQGSNAPSHVISFKNNLQYNLPGRSDHKVIGRDEDVVRVYQTLIAEPRRRVAITGMGGVGKTTLAIECAHIWSQEDKFKQKHFNNVAYIPCESKKSAEDAFSDLANTLNIKAKQFREIIKAIVSLYKEKYLLFILDNLEKRGDIDEFLEVQNLNTNVFAVATTQKELPNSFCLHRLAELDEESSDTLLNSILKETSGQYRETLKDDLKELHKLLGGLPLAIVHAAATVKCEEYTLSEYIKEYNKQVDLEIPDDFANENRKSVFKTLTINIEKVKRENNETSLKLLHYLGYLNQNCISMSFIKKIFGETPTTERALNLLARYSLVSRDGDRLRIHRLSQRVVRSYFQGSKPDLLRLLVVVSNGNWWQHLEFVKQHLNDDISDILDKATLETLNAEYGQVFCSHQEVISYVIRLGDKGYKVDVKEMMRWPVLHLLAAVHATSYPELSVAVVERLARETEGLDLQVQEGLTALHVAVAMRSDTMALILIRNGASLHVPDVQGRSPLKLAQLQGEKLVALLRGEEWCRYGPSEFN